MSNSQDKAKTKTKVPAPLAEYVSEHLLSQTAPYQTAQTAPSFSFADNQQSLQEHLLQMLDIEHVPYSPPKDAVPPKKDADGNIIFEINGMEYKMMPSENSLDDLLKMIPTRGVSGMPNK